MERRFVLFVAASAAFMAAVLLLDRDGLPAQACLGLLTAAFLWFFARKSQVPRDEIFAAIIIASIGEVVLSLGWQLYSYKHAIIPLYVPPGHGLFYALAADSSRQPLLRLHRGTIVRWVSILGSVMALVSLVFFHDTWGFFWWVVALVLIQRSRNQLMLAACFSYTIFLEWGGTYIGNWLWAPTVPFVGMHSANPPAGVGILYITLDLLVVLVTTQLRRLRAPGMAIIEPAA